MISNFLSKRGLLYQRMDFGEPLHFFLVFVTIFSIYFFFFHVAKHFANNQTHGFPIVLTATSSLCPTIPRSTNPRYLLGSVFLHLILPRTMVLFPLVFLSLMLRLEVFPLCRPPCFDACSRDIFIIDFCC